MFYCGLMRGREFKDAMFTQLERVASALASAKRLEIIDVLAQAERCVEAIAAETGLSVANTSRHLQVLRNAGLLASRRDGQHVIYRLADPAVIEGYGALRSLAGSLVAEVNVLAQAFFGDVDGAQPVAIDDLVERIRTQDVIVIDVRPELEFVAGHIEGATNIPLAKLAARMAELPGDSTIVAYCRGPYCVLAAQAVRQLRQVGYHAAWLEVGFPEWQVAGLPVTVKPPTNTHRTPRRIPHRVRRRLETAHDSQ